MAQPVVLPGGPCLPGAGSSFAALQLPGSGTGARGGTAAARNTGMWRRPPRSCVAGWATGEPAVGQWGAAATSRAGRLLVRERDGGVAAGAGAVPVQALGSDRSGGRVGGIAAGLTRRSRQASGARCLPLCGETDDLAPPDVVERALAGLSSIFVLSVVDPERAISSSIEQREVGERVASFLRTRSSANSAQKRRVVLLGRTGDRGNVGQCRRPRKGASSAWT